MPELSLSLAAYHGPHVRLTTHQRRRYRRRCKSGYQPAGLSFGWAGFAPAGRLIQNFKAASSTSYSNQTSIAWSHPQAGTQVVKEYQVIVDPCLRRGDEKIPFRDTLLRGNMGVSRFWALLFWTPLNKTVGIFVDTCPLIRTWGRCE